MENKDYYVYYCEKLFNNYITIRDYNLNNCYNLKKDLLIKYKKKEMIILHKDLKEKALKLDSKKYKSMYNANQEYSIYHIKWEPEIIENNQKTLL